MQKEEFITQREVGDLKKSAVFWARGGILSSRESRSLYRKKKSVQKYLS